MASVTFLLMLVSSLHLSACSSADVYRSMNTGSNAIGTSHTGYLESVCDEDKEKRSVDCDGLNLTNVPDYLSPDIQILTLRFNSIQSLSKSSLFRYPQLRTLKVGYNDIHTIESATFFPLNLLQHLDVSENGLTSFPENATNAEQFVRVRKLGLSSNELTHVNIACYPDGQNKVEKVSLSNNNFRELTSETLKLNCDINSLDLSKNPVTRIDPETIASLRVQKLLFGGKDVTRPEVWKSLLIGVARSQIKSLVILFTRQGIITPDFFSPLYNSPLSTLDLNAVDLNFQNITPFSNLNLLMELTIEFSNIPNLEPNFFLGMNKLQILHLEYNHIQQINPSDSSWSTIYVREIYLGFNDLYVLSRTAFQGLENLRVLDLAYNTDFKELLINSYTELFYLKYLNVSGTVLREFYLDAPSLISITSSNSHADYLRPGITFMDTPSLEWLDLSNSNVYSHHIWGPFIHTSLFDGLDSLKYLLLKDNHIFELVPGMFQMLFALEFLDLSHCEISSIDSNAFHDLSSLHTLSLEENKIQRIPVNLLANMNELLTYNLSANNLNYIDTRTFANTTALQTLLLAANKFTYINYSTFEPIISILESIDISQNPLICDCEISWLVKWLDGQVNVLNDHNTVCSTASATIGPLQGKPLLTFIPSEFCGPNIALICAIPLAVITVSVTICLIYHFRWFVRYKLYLLKLAVLGYEEVLDARDHGDFEFDLNIMFIEDDLQWVQEYLKPVMEERLPNFNRNAIGDGDLTLGMHYLDAVYHVMEKSFKTVLLLSRVAFQDNWFMVKFRIAFEQVNDARMENVVVVFLEDIPDAELPFLVRLYLSERRTYLWWVEDERGQEYFWNELVLTLQRDNMRWNNMVPPE